MSEGVGVENYAVILIWLLVCWLYTTLLAFTAFAVVFVLRKRRSSILKSQRPPRTPFSELEFNVATPTDTVKSRRVSFSRRTGVAEFVTNEATTTWKNFYEEHNKSLESSGNDSQVKAPRQTIGHIGKRIFDQQFEEVEAVDFLHQLSKPCLNSNASINNINLTQQLASFENTDNSKLSAPHTNFELSTFTENHSKLFGDELMAPTMEETSGRIDINFSHLQSINQGNDDLDEIQRDLERAQNNVNYIGPFADKQNMSEYIEIDLNTTHITMGNEQSDMSITDTIHSQVQDVSKNCSIDKKSSQTKDWVTDKENIAVNPYVTPRESVNFAINEEADKVLVFDGKRLTLQNERDDKNYRKTLLPDGPASETPQRKTIVLNVNDDLPNFIDDLHISKIESFKDTVTNNCDKDLSHLQVAKHGNIKNTGKHISMTEVVTSQNMLEINSDNSKTLVYEGDTCNISMTQALPANIIQNKVEKSQTILYENDGNMSVTQAVPVKIVVLKSASSDKRRTILFEDDIANISMTQALPINIVNENIQNKKSTIYEDEMIPETQDRVENKFIDDITSNQKIKLIMFENGNNDEISTNILNNDQKYNQNRTVIFENDMLNISVTQAVPSNIVFNDKVSLAEIRKTILYDDNMANLSVTEGIAKNIILLEKNEITHYDDEAGSIYFSQPAPNNNILLETENQNQSKKSICDNGMDQKLVSQVISSNNIFQENETLPQKGKSIFDENESCNISVTKANTSNVASHESETQRRRTIVYDNDAGNISVTQAIPTNILLLENEIQTQGKTIVYENDAGNISATETIPNNIILPENEAQTQRRRTIVYENDTGNVSVTQAIQSNIIIPGNETQTQRRKTVIYENDTGNISVTEAIPNNIILPESGAQTQRRRTIVYENDTGNISVTEFIPSNIIIPGTECQTQRRRTIVYDNDAGNISVTQAIPTNILLLENEIQTQKKTIVYENDAGNISVTEAIPSNIILPENEIQTQKRRTIIYENNTANISVTQAIQGNIILPENEIQADRTETIVNGNEASSTAVTGILSNNIFRDKDGLTDKIDNCRNDTDNNSVLKPVLFNISFLENRNKIEEQIIPNEITNRHISVNQLLPNNTKNQPVNEIPNKTHSVCVEALNSLVTPKIYIPDDEIDSNCRRISILDNKETLTSQEHKSDIVMTPAAVDTINTRQFEHRGDNKDIDDNCKGMITEVIPTDLLVKESIISKVVEMEIKNANKMNKIGPNDISATQDSINRLPIMKNTNCTIVLNKGNYESHELESENRKSSTVEDHMQNASIIKPIPLILSSIENVYMEKSMKEYKMSCETNSIDREVLLYPVTMKQSDLMKSTIIDQSKCQKVTDDKKIITSTATIVDPNINQENKPHVVEKKSTELSNQEEIIDSSESTFNEHKVDIEKAMNCQKRYDNSKCALDDLLDMSNVSTKYEMEYKNVMPKIESEQQLLEDIIKVDTDNISAESIFYITKDSDEEDKSDKEANQNIPSHLNRKEENTENVDRLQKKRVELKSIMSESNNILPNNRYYEQMVSSGVEQETEKNSVSRNQTLNCTKERKSYKTADDTDYLLQMLSDLTENKVSDIIEEDEKLEPIVLKDHIAIEDKTKEIEKKLISFVPKRQSVALSREELLNNISMAHAAMQNSKFELDESKNFEDTENDSSAEQESPCKKSVRMSNEVVKTLHFEEDDTASETSMKSDKISPLKKTAFGETSYMKERKSKVIPTYLKDVSDGIKALMHDLVKPNEDTMPFEAVGLDKNLKKSPSTCSTQIQANLMTSSQIDFDNDLYSNPTSAYDIKTQAAYANKTCVDKKTISAAHENLFQSVLKTESEKSSKSELFCDTDQNSFTRQDQLLKKQTMAGEVLIFDHENPLNNVFFAPTDCVNVHRYNPMQSDETLCTNEQNRSVRIPLNDKDVEVSRVSMQYNMDSHGVLPHLPLKANNICVENITGIQSITSTVSKPMSIDQSTDVRMVEVKDVDVNTSITMKGNEELLEATSSLTLVDDALTHNVFDVDVDTNATTSRNSLTAIKAKSPVKIICQIDECDIKTEIKSSDCLSTDEVTSEVTEQKRNKRNYSSMKNKNVTLSDLDVTPKPTSKVQKMSNSPKNIIKTILDLHRGSPGKNKVNTNKIESVMDVEMPSPDKSNKKSPRKSKDKIGTTITVQRLITDYHIETSTDQKALNKQIVEALTDQPVKEEAVKLEGASSVEPVSSFTSSKNVKEQEDSSISTSSRPFSVCSDRSANSVNWRSDLASEVGSKNLMSECESSVNVVAQIDMLPFMGSHECEWECSSGDTWSFRMLHSRLRLVVRFAHRHDNAPPTCVRPDTPVIATSVEIIQTDKKNPVASICIRFAAETMRYVCAQWCEAPDVPAVAPDVPALVRRCAGVARLAARWARAMHLARAHLACTLTDRGDLALKVANVPLRSVWEVTMRLELVAEEASAVPWPRAGSVRVSRVVAEREVSDATVREVLAAVPRDWGHAPRTIWRIFKYLKNKTNDDVLLSG